MNINLQIDHLILEGVDLPPSQRALVKATVERELSRLLASNGIPQLWDRGGNIPRLRTNINLTKSMSPQQIGQGMAQTIYAAMQPSKKIRQTRGLSSN